MHLALLEQRLEFLSFRQRMPKGANLLHALYRCGRERTTLSLLAGSLPGQRQRAVDDHFLAQRGGDDVGQTAKGSEDAPRNHPTKRLEEEIVAHQRNAPADHDTAGAQKRDHVANRIRQGVEGDPDCSLRVSIPVSSGGDNGFRG